MSSLKKHLIQIGKKNFLNHIHKNRILPSYKVKFKLTRKCNLKCQKCNYWKKPTGQELHKKDVFRIIDQICTLGCRIIKFSGGEVLLREDICDIISYAKNKKVSVSITTNGTLINTILAKKLIDSGVDQVSVSIDSHDATIHNELVGIRGSWEKSTKALNLLRKFSTKAGTRTRLIVQVVICRTNFEHLTKIIHLAANVPVDSISMIPFRGQHLSDNCLDLNEEQRRHFSKRLFPHIAEIASEKGISIINKAYAEILEDVKQSPSVSYYKTYSCYIPWLNYMISSDGKVYACCVSKEIGFELGSILEASLSDILTSNRFDSFRHQSKAPIEREVCRECLSEIKVNRFIEEWLNDGTQA